MPTDCKGPAANGRCLPACWHHPLGLEAQVLSRLQQQEALVSEVKRLWFAPENPLEVNSGAPSAQCFLLGVSQADLLGFKVAGCQAVQQAGGDSNCAARICTVTPDTP